MPKKYYELLSKGELRTASSPDSARYALDSMVRTVSPNAAAIPLANNVQAARLFYGQRFYNQAQPLAKPEAPLVQTLMDGDTSVDEMLGEQAGAVRFDDDAEVVDVQPGLVKWTDSKGQARTTELYRNFPFNRYSGIRQSPVVQPGQKLKRGALLARSNFTDDNGVQAYGVNARVALVPYKGFSQDDAIVLSESFAKRLTSHHMEMPEMDFSQGDLIPGKDHFVSLFPEQFKKDQLDMLDEHGVVQPGMTVRQGDPIVLASRPRSFNSNVTGVRGLKQATRAPAPLVWESQDPGTVLDVQRASDGSVRVLVESLRPARTGDKIAMRSGQKAITALTIPDEQMPRSMDGKPFEVLLNPLGLPSRANPSLAMEILLGKAAMKDGKPIKTPWFNRNHESRLEQVRKELEKRGIPSEEQVWDPVENKVLEQPVTTGSAYVLKLHHIAEKKASWRGQSGYDSNEQPSRGGGATAQAKRLSGLENTVLRSSGATNVLGEMSTLRGQRDDEFWKAYRSGDALRQPKQSFVFNKFKVLLNGAGMHAQDLEDGRTRLGFLTDKIVEKFRPVELRNGETIRFSNMSPVPGGLFDPGLVASNSWARIPLDEPMPNPAAEKIILQLLGLTRTQLDGILTGTEELPES